MKRYTIILIVICVGLLSLNEKDKEYTLKLTQTDLQALQYCFDKTRAEHDIVIGLQNKIIKQLEPQYKADTTH